MNGFLRMICALALLSGCAAVEATLAPEVDLSRYDAVHLVSPQEDPMGLESAIAAELAKMGYEILGEPPSTGEVPEVRFSYSIGPDIDDQGVVVTRMTRFVVRFLDSGAARLLAEAEYFSGGDSATAAEGIGAAFDKLRLARSVPAPASRKREEPESQALPDPPQRKVRPTPKEAQNFPVSEEQNSADAKPQESPETPTPSSSEAQTQDSPWKPRLQSWGFEKWGEK